jgi:uncharacterized protein YggT (Ycf19 family)
MVLSRSTITTAVVLVFFLAAVAFPAVRFPFPFLFSSMTDLPLLSVLRRVVRDTPSLDVSSRLRLRFRFRSSFFF